MPIINGKKRYIPEAPPDPDAEVRRYRPETSDAPPMPIKRYKPMRIPQEKKIKRAKDGGKAVQAVLNRETTRNFLSAFEFDVRINTIQVNFSKISNISSEIETETFVEGGNNDFPVIRQKARTKPDILVLEKGMTDTTGGGIFALFRQGMRLTNIMIFVKRNGKISRTYTIDEALVVSKKFSDLDANSSQLYIEKLELAHTGISEMSQV